MALEKNETDAPGTPAAELPASESPVRPDANGSETKTAPSGSSAAAGTTGASEGEANGTKAEPSSGETSEPAPEPEAATAPPGESKKKSSLAKKIGEIPLLVFLAFFIAVIIKTFLVQAFYIPSGSMIPTLRVGDRVLVEKVSYLWGRPSRGDVIVFEKSVFGAKNTPDLPWYDDARVFLKEMLGLPTGINEDYIKRVVAVGGDTISYRGSPRKMFINGEKVDQSYVRTGKDSSSPTLTGDDCKRLKMERAGKACRVPAGKLFVMGDNRNNSEDSRVLGPIDGDKVVGRAFVVIWPPADFGGL